MIKPITYHIVFAMATKGKVLDGRTNRMIIKKASWLIKKCEEYSIPSSFSMGSKTGLVKMLGHQGMVEVYSEAINRTRSAWIEKSNSTKRFSLAVIRRPLTEENDKDLRDMLANIVKTEQGLGK